MRRKQPDPNCDLCGGTGEVDAPVWNSDAHVYEPTGTQPCICTIPDESDDERDDDIGGGGSQPIRPIEPQPTNDKGGGGYALPEDILGVPSPLEGLPAQLMTI